MIGTFERFGVSVDSEVSDDSPSLREAEKLSQKERERDYV